MADCIASWVDAGFAPATINARSERVDPGSRIRQVVVERDASEITGKPHPYFGDLLLAIAEQTTGPFALLNADVLIPSGAELAAKVASLRPGRMIIGRRLNLAQLGVSGTPYFYGYDFFAAHSADVTALGATQLVFGAPWWDHFFPLAMHLHGCQIEQLRPEVIHLNHDERWDSATWMTLGDRFVAEMRPLVGDGEYARRLRRILGTDTHAPHEERRLALSRVGKLNLSVIDRLAPLPPSSGVRTPPRLRVQAALLRRTAVSDLFSSTGSMARPPRR